MAILLSFGHRADPYRPSRLATDRTTPHTLRRWGATAVLFILFFARILFAQAYYIVCYALGCVSDLGHPFLPYHTPANNNNPLSPSCALPPFASCPLPPLHSIYLLNLFLAFLQPKFDPSLAADMAEAEVEEGAPGLPTSMPSPGANGGAGGGAYGDLQDGEFRPFIRRLPEFKFWCVRLPPLHSRTS